MNKAVHFILIALFFAGGIMNPAIKILELLNPKNFGAEFSALSHGIAWMGILFLGPLQLVSAVGFLLKKKWSVMTALLLAGAFIFDMGIWISSEIFMKGFSAGLIPPVLFLLESFVILLFIYFNFFSEKDFKDKLRFQ